MSIHTLRDRSQLEVFLRKHPYLHLYALGDLDDFFWPYTTWYGIILDGQLAAICTLYSAFDPPVLLALAAPVNQPNLRKLLAGIYQNLPKKLYGHLSLGLEPTLQLQWSQKSSSEYLKMAYREQNASRNLPSYPMFTLTPDMAQELIHLCQESYPDHAFDPRMLTTGQFLGIQRSGNLVSAGGVHIYSSNYRVAALGNIVTHPDHRGQGMATAITSALCRRLAKTVDHIGLNVRADNHTAIRIYQRCGFRQITRYQEAILTKQEC